MNSRTCIISTLSVILGLFLCPDAFAEPRASSGYANPVHSRLALDRELESAMLQMDRNLSALLGSRTLDCVEHDAIAGMETCWVSLDSAKAVDGSRGAVPH